MKGKKQTLFLLMSLLLALTLNVCVTAETVVVSDKASYVHGSPDANNFNFGADADLEITENEYGPRHGLVQWNLSGYSLAPGETVSATIRLKHSWGDVNSLNVYQIPESWIEGTDINSVPADSGVTWNTEPNLYIVGGVDTYTDGWHNISGEGLDILVESWIRGTSTNNGVGVRHPEFSNVLEGLYSDDSNAPDRPQLVFTVLPATSKKVVLSDKVTFIQKFWNVYNFGGRNELRITDNIVSTGHALVGWNLSGYSIPSGSSVFDAKIRLKHKGNGVSLFNGGLYKISEPWTEGVGVQFPYPEEEPGGTPATDGSITWKKTFGLTGTSNLLGLVSVPTNPEDYNSVTGWHEISGPTLDALVEDWITGDVNNNGVMLRHYTTSQVELETIYSDDESFFGNWPQLVFSIRPPLCGDPGFEAPKYDLSGDCKVDFVDFALVAKSWLESTEPNAPAGQIKRIASTKSTYVHGHWEWQNWNYGAKTSLEICQSDLCMPYPTSTGSPRRAFIAWDLSQFGKTAQISDANIILTKAYSQDQASTYPLLELSMEVIAEDWVEGDKVESPGDSNIPETSWLYEPSRVGYEAVCPNETDPNGWYTWESVAVVNWYGAEILEPPYTQYTFKGEAVTDLVQGWIANPEQNFGAAFVTHDPNGVGDYCFLGLFSDDAYGDDEQYRPLLEFTVTGCGENPYLFGDFNKDCHVDLLDLKEVADGWLGCTAPECP